MSLMLKILRQNCFNSETLYEYAIIPSTNFGGNSISQLKIEEKI